MLDFDKGSFTRKKRAVTTSGKALRQNVQDLIEMGLAHYVEHGDTCYLTEAMNVCLATRTIRTIAVQAYIESVANVKWTKTKNSRAFVKMKGDKGVKVEPRIDLDYINMKKWYEDAENRGQDIPDMKVDVQFKSLLSRTKKALDEGRVDNPDHAKLILEQGQKLVALFESEEPAH